VDCFALCLDLTAAKNGLLALEAWDLATQNAAERFRASIEPTFHLSPGDFLIVQIDGPSLPKRRGICQYAGQKRT
jgi:hypothetical protein